MGVAQQDSSGNLLVQAAVQAREVGGCDGRHQQDGDHR